MELLLNSCEPVSLYTAHLVQAYGFKDAFPQVLEELLDLSKAAAAVLEVKRQLSFSKLPSFALTPALFLRYLKPEAGSLSDRRANAVCSQVTQRQMSSFQAS